MAVGERARREPIRLAFGSRHLAIQMVRVLSDQTRRIVRFVSTLGRNARLGGTTKVS